MNATEQFIYFCACGITDTRAEADSVDFEALWKMARSHNLNALIARSLSDTKAFQAADPAEQKRWRNALNANIKKSMRFDAERGQLFRFFEKSGIRYLPLKGAVINRLYPSYGLREFADNDILIDAERTQDAKRFMLERGYTLREDSFTADEYSKAPFFNFELHRSLTRKGASDERHVAYYQDVWERVCKDSGNAFGYHFSDEDFYIYFIFHAFKHYDNRGTGFRTLTDEYVILQSDTLHLDFRRMEKTLEKLGLYTFERNLRLLAQALFTHPERTGENLADLSDDLRGMLLFILSSGTFGTMENLFAKEFSALTNGTKHSKLRYYRQRLFPPVSRYQYTHPFIYKHKIVYPFFLMYRLAVNPIKHRKYLRQERLAVKNIQKQQTEHNTGV